jgi:hypothetical protein
MVRPRLPHRTRLLPAPGSQQVAGRRRRHRAVHARAGFPVLNLTVGLAGPLAPAAVALGASGWVHLATNICVPKNLKPN